MLSTQKGLPLKIITNNIYLKSSFKTSKALIFLFYFSQWHLEVFNIKTKILCTNSSALGRAAILFIQQIPRPRYVCTWHKRQWSAAFVLYIHTCIKSTRLACRRPLFPLFPLVSCSPTHPWNTSSSKAAGERGEGYALHPQLSPRPAGRACAPRSGEWGDGCSPGNRRAGLQVWARQGGAGPEGEPSGQGASASEHGLGEVGAREDSGACGHTHNFSIHSPSITSVQLEAVMGRTRLRSSGSAACSGPASAAAAAATQAATSAVSSGPQRPAAMLARGARLLGAGCGESGDGPAASLPCQTGPFQVVGGDAGSPRLRPPHPRPRSGRGRPRRLLSAGLAEATPPPASTCRCPGCRLPWQRPPFLPECRAENKQMTQCCLS